MCQSLSRTGQWLLHRADTVVNTGFTNIREGRVIRWTISVGKVSLTLHLSLWWFLLLLRHLSCRLLLPPPARPHSLRTSGVGFILLYFILLFTMFTRPDLFDISQKVKQIGLAATPINELKTWIYKPVSPNKCYLV